MTREEEIAKEIKDLANQGYSLIKISIELDIEPYKISQIMKKYGIEKIGKKVITKLEEKKIIKLYCEEKLKVVRIAERFNVSVYEIRKVLIDNGLIIPRHKRYNRS